MMNQDIGSPSGKETQGETKQPQTSLPTSLKPVKPDTKQPNGNGGKDEGQEKQKTNWPSRIQASCTVILVFITGFYTYYAARQRDAMLESNRINRDALESVQRAFVNFSPNISVALVTDKRGTKVIGWQFSIPMENSGNTTTREMFNHVNVKLLDGELPKDFNYPDLGSQTPTPIVLGPKQSIASIPLLVKSESIKAVQGRTKHLYFYGWTRYRDVFQNTKPHITKFCYELTQVGGDDPTLVKIKGFYAGFSLCPHHNCTDEECDKNP
jgi:hypothetical protein